MQYIDNLYLSRLLEKSGKSQGISCGLESGHPDIYITLPYLCLNWGVFVVRFGFNLGFVLIIY